MAFILAVVATIVAVVKLRSRRDLVIGSAVLAVLIFALAVWLPFRTTHRR